jgi:hypothetical protein
MVPGLLVAFVIFYIGYRIGLRLYSESEKQLLYALLCGVAAVVVTIALVFAGCSIIIGNTRP